MPEGIRRTVNGALVGLTLLLGGCASGLNIAGATPTNDPDINVYPANYKPEILGAMHAYLSDPTGIRDAAIAPAALKTVGGSLRYVVCLRFNAKKPPHDAYAGSKELSAVFVAGRFDRFAEIPKGDKAGRDERDRCVGAAYAPFPELGKLTR